MSQQWDNLLSFTKR